MTTEALRAYNHRWYLAHRDQILAEHAARYAADPEGRHASNLAWQRANPEKVRAAYSRYRRKVRAMNMTDLRALKLLRGCIDCGYDENSDALQFDHVRGTKLGDVAAFAGTTSALIAEIAKCEVRCSNCHSIVTAQRRAA